MARVLIIDADPNVRRLLGISLGTIGHRVVEVDNVAEGTRLGQGRKFDLVILEPGFAEVPDMNGHEVITAIRQRSTAPIIVLSSCADEARKVEALDRGADDYVVKPFSIGELMARVRAALRQKRHAAEPGIVIAGDVRIDLTQRRIFRNGEDVHLTKREFALLKALASSPDHVLTHQALIKAAWGQVRGDAITYLRVFIMQLRAKLERNPSSPTIIVTEQKAGYRLKTTGHHILSRSAPNE
jgi:two-component system KDP operon response regulator KdpE